MENLKKNLRYNLEKFSKVLLFEKSLNILGVQRISKIWKIKFENKTRITHLSLFSYSQFQNVEISVVLHFVVLTFDSHSIRRVGVYQFLQYGSSILKIDKREFYVLVLEAIKLYFGVTTVIARVSRWMGWWNGSTYIRMHAT